MIRDESIRIAFEANGLILGVGRATVGFWRGEQSGHARRRYRPWRVGRASKTCAIDLVEQRTLDRDRYVYRLAIHLPGALPRIGCRSGRPRTGSANAANPLMTKYRIDQ
jgi:hypothetical protein